MDPAGTPRNTEPRMESRYAQERVCSSCWARFAGPAANRVRGIVGIIEPRPRPDVDRTGQATSAALSNVPPPGSLVLQVQKSAVGWVLALTNGQVVYAVRQGHQGRYAGLHRLLRRDLAAGDGRQPGGEPG